MLIGLRNQDSAVQKYWTKIPCEGEASALEGVILFLAEVKRNSQNQMAQHLICIAIIPDLEYNVSMLYRRCNSMDYISAKAAAQKWGISQRRVAVLCSENRIQGATVVGNMWLIPQDAQKPTDGRSLRYMNSESQRLKPFIKWAGGKGQLLSDIRNTYPKGLGTKIKKYAEPFVGGGAVLFDILTNYDLDEIYISDTNAELINTYRIIRDDPDELVEALANMQAVYVPADTEARKEYYYKCRERFNYLKVNGDEVINIEKAALFIFLNKTCFNGLYRVNRKGLYNVPIGAYKNPCICDEDNLRRISASLQKVTIVCGDYRESVTFIDENTFAYFDPPYRPLTATSAFTSYTEDCFDDRAQIALSKYVEQLDKLGAKVIISNSDPKNANPDDNFFDKIYSRQQIKRVAAARMINSNANSRGKINELLICNF